MNVKLKCNGQVKDAVLMENGIFQVTMAKGEPRFYSADDVIVIEEIAMPEVQEPTPVLNDSKEGHMKKSKPIIHHYMFNEVVADGNPISLRYITTVVDPAHMEDYNKSKASHRPEGNVLSISNGAWEFTLLQSQLCDSYKNFTVIAVRNKDLVRLAGRMELMLGKATFAHANSTYSFFLEIHGGTRNFGLADMGLTIDSAKKTSKRLAELYRLAEMNFHSYKLDSIKWDFFDVEEDEEMLVDGKSIISMSFALRMVRGVRDNGRRHALKRDIESGKIVNLTIRGLTPSGLLKGDAMIISDEQMGDGVDIRTWVGNIKNELILDNQYHFTAWEHALSHMAVWDDQSTINFGVAMPESKQTSDINRLITNMRVSLEAGEFPEWMLIGEKDRNEDGLPDLEKLSDSLNKMWIRWQSHGLDVKAGQNMAFMALGGLIKRMEGDMKSAAWDEKTSYFDKMWLPMTNAALYSVVTYELCAKYANFTFTGQDPDVMFYDERVGLVMPGKRFIQTFDLHGTWDLDDTVKVIWIKLWSSDDYSVHLGKTLADDVVLPSTKEDAIDMLMLVRSPNGPGEYSIEKFNLDGMFNVPELIDLTQIVTVDMAKMPLPQDVMLESVDVRGLPDPVVYSKEEMTREDAHDMLTAQMVNPGVGFYCNGAMAFARHITPQFPKSILANMGDIVDNTEMGVDINAFKAISKESNNLFKLLVKELKDNPALPVDKAICVLRMPANVQLELQDRCVDGRFTRVQNSYKMAIQVIRKELQYKTMQWRMKTELVQSLRHVAFGSDIMVFSAKFFAENMLEMSVIGKKWEVAKDADAFTKANASYQKTLELAGVVENMVTVFMDMDESERYRHIVGMYKWMCLSNLKGEKMGQSDRLIFQPATQGKLALMDILIEGLYHYGLTPSM